MTRRYVFDKELSQMAGPYELVEEIANHDCGIHGDASACMKAFQEASRKLIEKHNNRRLEVKG